MNFDISVRFDDSGNSNIQYSVYRNPAKEKEMWSVSFVPIGQFAENLNRGQKEKIDKLTIVKEGQPQPLQIVETVCDLIDKSKQEQNKELGIKFGAIDVDEEWKDLLVEKMDERFGMKPVESFSTPTELKG